MERERVDFRRGAEGEKREQSVLLWAVLFIFSFKGNFVRTKRLDDPDEHFIFLEQVTVTSVRTGIAFVRMEKDFRPDENDGNSGRMGIPRA